MCNPRDGVGQHQTHRRARHCNAPSLGASGVRSEATADSGTEAAALPFVDDFLPARTLNDFGDLASHLNALAERS